MKKVRLDVLAAPSLGLLTLIVLSGFTVGPMGPRNSEGLFAQASTEGCPGVSQAPGATLDQGTDCPGGASGLWSVLIPAAAVVFGSLGLALVLALVIISRPERAAPVSARQSREWWTCANCGTSNIVETLRCFNCGSWRTAQASPATPPGATPP